MLDSAYRLGLKVFLRRFRVPRDLARYAFRRYPDRTVLIAPRGRLTYAQLEDRVLRLVAGLERAGIGKGAPLFSLLRDDWEQVEVRLAAAEIGALHVPFHEAVPPRQILDAAQTLTPAAFIYDPALGEGIAKRLAGEHPEVLLLDVGAEGSYERLIAEHDPRQSTASISPEEPASLGFTSGTTGKPKALFVNHGVILTSLKMVAVNVRFTPGRGAEVVVLGIPLIGAGSGALYPVLVTGSTLVLPPSYETDDVLRAIQVHQATRTFITPSQLIDILDHPECDPSDLRSLRNVIYGTAPIPAAKLEEALRRFGPIFQQGYGMAEVLPPVSLLQMHEHVQGREPAPREVLRSAGRVVPGVEVRIVDDAGNPLPVGEVGEILVRSPTVFSGYWGRPDLTEQVLQDGWMRTGDVGYLSKEGWLYVLDRKQDLLQRDGQVIYPRLVEEVAHDHPAVKEACVVAAPESNEHVLCLSLRHGYRGGNVVGLAAEILAFMSSRLEAYQVPDRVEIFEELPRSYLRKVLRREVRQALGARQRAIADQGTLGRGEGRERKGSAL